jgi:hypothetical protein
VYNFGTVTLDAHDPDYHLAWPKTTTPRTCQRTLERPSCERLQARADGEELLQTPARENSVARSERIV